MQGVVCEILSVSAVDFSARRFFFPNSAVKKIYLTVDREYMSRRL